jgi:hypothetical protein
MSGVLLPLAMLGCPIGMGLMMRGRGGEQHSGRRR